MSWAADTVAALHSTFEGTVDDLALGVGAVDADDRASEVRPDAASAHPFEVGSIGKTFTATLVALAVVEGRASLDDPVGRWLDAGANAGITLEQLATHTSGLPRLAPNWRDWDGYDDGTPYLGYTAELAEAALRDVEPAVGAEVAYSNFGFQLLGLVVERLEGRPLADVVVDRLFAPLGMPGAAVTGRSASPVAGHDELGAATPAWRQLALPGPGGYEATAADLTAYAAAVLAPPEGPLGTAIRLALEPRVDHGDARVGLAWHRHPSGLHWHNGGTGGFHSCLAVDLDGGRAALALSNHADHENLDPAVMAAALGRDPLAFRPAPVDDRWVDRARAVVDDLIGQEWAAIRAAGNEKIAAALTDERLAAGWDEVVGRRGGEVVEVVRQRASRTGAHVRVQFVLRLTGGNALLIVTFDEDERVAGLQIA